MPSVLKDFLKEISKKHFDFYLIGLLSLLSLLFLLEALFTLRWRMYIDAPPIHYAAFLYDKHHFSLYKDVFETSMPGTFLFHLIIGKIFGYTDTAFRIPNLIWLGTHLAVTWAVMKRFGRMVAWGSVVFFGLSYLKFGSSMMLQREYFPLLPISAAVLIALKPPSKRLLFSSFVIGLCFGFSAMVKPQLAIGLPLLLAFIWSGQFAVKRKEIFAKDSLLKLVKIALTAFAGLAIPVGVSLYWVWKQGGWESFTELVFQYLPLHLNINGVAQVNIGLRKFFFAMKSVQTLSGLTAWLVAASFGIYFFFHEIKQSRQLKKQLYLLTGLAFIYFLYPNISGQYRSYDWMPFQYFLVLLASLILLPLPKTLPKAKRAVPLVVITMSVLLGIFPPMEFFYQIRGKKPDIPKIKRVDQMAEFLKENLEPGDTVQSLDWLGGAVHAMLLSKAVTATPFIYDYHFYHNISHPQIQKMRKRFINDLRENPPRFMIQVLLEKPWLRGTDTTKKFDELWEILKENYRIALIGTGFFIYERRGGGGPANLAQKSDL